MVPRKVDPVPNVGELPTCRKTLLAGARLIRFALLVEALMSVEPAWKTKCALGFPPPLSVTVPVSPIEETGR